MANIKKEEKESVTFSVKVRVYFENVVSEMRRVSWPTREELKESTLVVLTVTGVLALFTFIIDNLIGEVIKQFFK